MFYDEYANDEKWQQLVAKLPWGHNLLLIEKIKDKEIRKIYTEKEQLPKDLLDKLPTKEEINLYLNVKEGEE